MVDGILHFVKCKNIFDKSNETRTSMATKMIPKATFLVLVVSGVAMSVIFSVLPNISTMFTSNDNQLDGSSSGGCLTEVSKSGADSKLVLDTLKMFHTAVSTKKENRKINKELSTEALTAVTMAKEMWEHGKVEKALKLFQHALALDPSHPDVLNEYGEFVETTQKDIVKAEHMYCRALVLHPTHSRALSNRHRTLPIVEEIDRRAFDLLDEKRDILINVPESHPGLRRMKKENYVRHIYHTTAIEGNTFTLAETRAFVETNMAIGGKSIIEHNEILGLDSALSYINSTLVYKLGHITVDDILDIHRRVLGFVDPIGAGHFRTTQVFVGDHVPPPPKSVEGLVEDFIDWLNSEEALRLHVIEYAALAHYKLVFIHPFYDGNGRTSRLLMNLILMQAGYPPIIIKVEEKHQYFKLLQTANNGDVRPFIRFIAKCTERTLDEYIMSAVENPAVTARQLPDGYHQHLVDDGRTIIIEEEDYVP